MKKAYQIHEMDNVATVIVDVDVSEELEIVSLQGDVISKMKLKEKIISGHKLAITPCDKGDKIIKYGEIIGVASDMIAAGDWVHTHNVDVNAGAILEGEKSLSEVREKIFKMVLETASGKNTKAEALGFKDFAVFSRNRTAEKLLGNC